MAAYLRAGIPLKTGEIAGFEPRPLQFHNLVSLPMSHHCSLESSGGYKSIKRIIQCHILEGRLISLLTGLRFGWKKPYQGHSAM
jgi:hypothetical protein